jgi:hypothetical protein
MNPQDFKIAVSSLNRIAEAIESRQEDKIVKSVNQFAVVFRMIKKFRKDFPHKTKKECTKNLDEIIKTHAEIAFKLLNNETL